MTFWKNSRFLPPRLGMIILAVALEGSERRIHTGWVTLTEVAFVTLGHLMADVFLS